MICEVESISRSLLCDFSFFPPQILSLIIILHIVSCWRELFEQTMKHSELLKQCVCSIKLPFTQCLYASRADLETKGSFTLDAGYAYL